MKNQRSMRNAREAALIALLKIEQEQAYANLALRQVLSAYPLSNADKRLVSELVYGTVRMRAALDHILSALLTRPLPKLDVAIRHILRISLYQLLYMERVPDSAAVHQAVELAKHYGHKGTSGLVNGVLRGYLRQQSQYTLPDQTDIRAYLSITLSYPLWLVDYLLARWPREQVIDFCLYHNRHHGLDLRVNTLRLTREDLRQELLAAGHSVREGAYAPETLLVKEGGGALPALLAEGKFLVQGQASQLIAHALDPAPHSKIIDLCAAPGGKATHLAQLMQNCGEIVAVDLHPHRSRLIEDNARRLGISIISSLTADGRDLPAQFHGYADYVLLDAPCSGLGVLGSRADARWRKQPADIQEMAGLSLELLKAAAAYIKPGGYICFSTCTVTEEENTDNIERFLAARPDFHRAPMNKLAQLLHDEQDKQAALAGDIQLMPQRHGLEGFFISLLRKE